MLTREKCFICLSQFSKAKLIKRSETEEDEVDSQLNAIFILKHILELHSELLWDCLRRCGNPGQWLYLCGECNDRIHQIREVFKGLQQMKRKFEKEKWDIQEDIRNARTRKEKKRTAPGPRRMKERELSDPGIEDDEDEVFGLRALFCARGPTQAPLKLNPYSDGDLKAKELALKNQVPSRKKTNEDKDPLPVMTEMDPHDNEVDYNDLDPASPSPLLDNEAMVDVITGQWYTKTDRVTPSLKKSDSEPLVPSGRGRDRGRPLNKRKASSSRGRSHGRPSVKCSRTTEIGEADELSTSSPECPAWEPPEEDEDNATIEIEEFVHDHDHDDDPLANSEVEVKYEFTSSISNPPMAPLVRYGRGRGRPPKSITSQAGYVPRRKKVKGGKPGRPLNTKLSRTKFCETCGKGPFGDYFGKLLHWRTVHEKEFSKDCPHCGKTFISRYYLKDHLARIHGIGVLCPCGKAFDTEATLEAHKIKVHGSSDVKPRRPCEQECDICGHKYSNNVTLKVHLASKHGIGDFTCEVCKEVFAFAGGLANHKVKKHGTPKALKKFRVKCDLCGNTYKNKGSLLGHIRITHNRQYEKECEICGKTMPNSAKMKEHMRMKHLVENLEIQVKMENDQD